MQDYPYAQAAWQDAARLYPGDREARLGLAETAWRLGRMEEAETRFAQLQDYPPATLPAAELALACGDFPRCRRLTAQLAGLEWNETETVRVAAVTEGCL